MAASANVQTFSHPVRALNGCGSGGGGGGKSRLLAKSCRLWPEGNGSNNNNINIVINCRLDES